MTTSLEDGGINLPAVVIVLVITLLLMRGVKETANLNNIMVVIKLGVLAMFIGARVHRLRRRQPVTLLPQGTGGVVAAAALIFFAYIGFDAVSTGSEEAKNPKDLPIAIVGSLLICTIIYVLVSVGRSARCPPRSSARATRRSRRRWRRVPGSPGRRR